MEEMTSEFGSVANIRFLIGTPKSEDENDWVYVLDGLPKEGEKVLCHGNKTLCCELDMEDAQEHVAIFRIKESSWRRDENGNKYDVVTYPSFEIDDEPHHLIFVSRWKRKK